MAVKNALLIKRQAEAASDFAGAMKIMAAEVGRLYGETDLAKTQMDWEKAMAQSQSMEERMSMFLDGMEGAAAADVSAAPTEAISDEEIDREVQMASMQTGEPLDALKVRLLREGGLARIRMQLLREKTASLLYERLPG